MRRLLVLALLAAAVVVLPGAEPAFACTCEAGRSVAQRINDSEIAFVGEFVSNDEQKGNARYRVVKAVKGVEEGEVVTIASDSPAPVPGQQAVPGFGGGDCRLRLPRGDEVAVTVSEGPDGRLTASQCNEVSLGDLDDYAQARDRLPLLALFGGLGIALLFFAARRTKARRDRRAI